LALEHWVIEFVGENATAHCAIRSTLPTVGAREFWRSSLVMLRNRRFLQGYLFRRVSEWVQEHESEFQAFIIVNPFDPE